MHLVQTKILLPLKGLYFLREISLGTKNHWRLGYFLFLPVGLYLVARNLFLIPKTLEVLLQIKQVLDINFKLIPNSKTQIPNLL